VIFRRIFTEVHLNQFLESQLPLVGFFVASEGDPVSISSP